MNFHETKAAHRQHCKPIRTTNERWKNYALAIGIGLVYVALFAWALTS